MIHLKKVLKRSTFKQMRARDLAAEYGPILVRVQNGDRDTMYADKKYQVDIVESLITHVSMLPYSPI
jgi:hypothetical protein